MRVKLKIKLYSLFTCPRLYTIGFVVYHDRNESIKNENDSIVEFFGCSLISTVTQLVVFWQFYLMKSLVFLSLSFLSILLDFYFKCFLLAVQERHLDNVGLKRLGTRHCYATEASCRTWVCSLAKSTYGDSTLRYGCKVNLIIQCKKVKLGMLFKLHDIIFIFKS